MAEIYHAEVLKKKITVLITYCGVIYTFKCSSCLSHKDISQKTSIRFQHTFVIG